MTNNAVLLLFAIVNVVVTALFAGMVLRQYARRHRIYQLYWSVALTMAFLATLAYVLMIIAQPTSSAGVVLFRIYYMLGGALVPAWLGLGSIALVSSPRVTRACFIVLSLLSIVAMGLIATAGVDMKQLDHIAGTPGTAILLPSFGAWTIIIIVLNTLGTLALVGVAAYSGWKLVRRQSNVAGFRTTNLVRANVLILVGALLNGFAGSSARFLASGFWLIMSLGWIVFFIGVLLTSRRTAASRTTMENRSQVELKGPIAST